MALVAVGCTPAFPCLRHAPRSGAPFDEGLFLDDVLVPRPHNRHLGQHSFTRRWRPHHSDRVKQGVRWWRNSGCVAHTIALALAASIYPTILAGVIVILGQDNPRRLLLGFLLGGMTVSIVFGVAITNALRESDQVIDLEQTSR